MRSGIFIAGNVVVDVVKTVSCYPQRGMLSDIRSLSRAVGGCVPNTLLSLAAMGGDIPLAAAGRVGEDDAGAYVLEQLARAGVDTSRVRVTPGEATAFSDVMTEADTGYRTFFHHRGANRLFVPEDLPPESLSCRMLHMGYILLLDGFDAPDPDYGTAMARYLHRAQQAGIITSVDAVSGQGADFRRTVEPALAYADYAIMNEVEGCAAAGLEPRDGQGRLRLDHIRATLEHFMDRGVSRMAVLHAPEGGFAMDRSGRFTREPSLRLPEGYIQGTVGAGDAFCAGCLYSIYQGEDASSMLRFAAAAAAACLSRSDSVSGMVSAATLREMTENWEVNEL